MYKFVVGFICLMLIAGCVTEYDKPERTYDKQAALEANIKLGMSYLDQGNRENASRAFVRAIEIDKNSAEAYQGMAILHQLNGETTLAEENFQKALNSDADFSMAAIKTSYGRFLVEQQKYDDALVYFEEAASDITYRSRPEALYLIGDTSLKVNNVSRAKSAFTHSINIDPKFSPSMLALANLMFEEEDYARSKQYLDRFSQNSDATPASLWLGIRIERVFGNQDKEASYGLALKNLFPYSKEYLSYKRLLEDG